MGHHYGDSIGEVSLFTVFHMIVHKGSLSEWVLHRGLREGEKEGRREGGREGGGKDGGD